MFSDSWPQFLQKNSVFIQSVLWVFALKQLMLFHAICAIHCSSGLKLVMNCHFYDNEWHHTKQHPSKRSMFIMTSKTRILHSLVTSTNESCHVISYTWKHEFCTEIIDSSVIICKDFHTATATCLWNDRIYFQRFFKNYF